MNTATEPTPTRRRRKAGVPASKTRRFVRGAIRTDAPGSFQLGCWVSEDLNNLVEKALGILASKGRDTDRSKFMRMALHDKCQTVINQTVLN